MFGGVLDETVPIQSVHVCGEDIEILKSFTYLGSVVHNDGGSSQEVNRPIGLAHGVMDSLNTSINFVVVDTCAYGQRLGSSSRW